MYIYIYIYIQAAHKTYCQSPFPNSPHCDGKSNKLLMPIKECILHSH